MQNKHTRELIRAQKMPHKLDVPMVGFIYPVFIYMPGKDYCRRLGSLFLCLCDVFQALINSLAC